MNPALIRITFDSHDDVWRDLRIEENQTLLALHNAIVSAFGLETGEMASFYVSDEDWNTLDPIALVDLSETGGARMDQLMVGDVLALPGDRLLYVYDFLRMRTFYVERMAETFETGIAAPLGLVGSFGTLPAPEATSDSLLFDETDLDDADDFEEWGDDDDPEGGLDEESLSSDPDWY
ncbi:hypothetical protein GC167_07675 [bacterium]|nr:hypothetical protein [bacterium]